MEMMFSPDWFKQTLGWYVERVIEDVFYKKETFNNLARIFLESQDPGVPARVILKRTFPGTSAEQDVNDLYPYEGVREYHAYLVLPTLGVPVARVYFSAIDPVTGQNLILMEDLTLSMRIFPPEHMWSFAEMQSILETYACFHTAGFRAGEKQPLRDQFPWLVSQHIWLDPALFERTTGYLRSSPVTSGRVAGCEATFAALLDLIDPLKRFLAGQRETFNYNDFFPGNVAIPIEPGPGRPALLFDWHCMGAGMLQNDLLNVLWGWSLENQGARDAAIQFYLDRLNPQAGTAYDLSWAKQGMLIAQAVDIYQALMRLANLLPRVEQGKARLPGWMEEQVEELEAGEVEKLVREVAAVLGSESRC